MQSVSVLCSCVAGRAFESLSIIVFLLMLILMGKGYTITRGKLSAISTVKVTIFFTIYTIVYVVVFIWEGIVSLFLFILSMLFTTALITTAEFFVTSFWLAWNEYIVNKCIHDQSKLSLSSKCFGTNSVVVNRVHCSIRISVTVDLFWSSW